tara:strand:- start:482 stop:787 length:306 start_codon:yes stop_codon:yes gene_type:complete
MLCWVKASPQAESQFWGQIYTKLLPSRQQLEQDGKMQDDGRVVLGLISRLQQIKEECTDVELAQNALPGEVSGEGDDCGDASGHGSDMVGPTQQGEVSGVG